MDIKKNIEEFSNQELKRLRAERKELEANDKELEKALQNQPMPLEPVDLYQQSRDRINSVNTKSFPNGSSAIVNTAVNAVVDGMGAEGLARAYKRAKDDSDSLKARGERGRAGLRAQQYMQESFLPAVELVVNSASPDELLANKKALEELDKYALLEGAGKGYTAAYVRQAYGGQLGQVNGKSSPAVRDGVMRLNLLLDNGEIRTALGLANKLKEQVDNGAAMADENDYELLGRIVAYYA